MRTQTLVVSIVMGVCLAVAACSKPTQDKTAQDLKAVGSEVGAAAKDVAATPAVKALGSDIIQGADEAGDKMKAGAAKAGESIKAGAKSAGDKTDAALAKASDSATKK